MNAKRSLISLTLCLSTLLGTQAQTVVATKAGVRINPSNSETATEVQWYTDAAVRVLKYPKSLTAAPEH
jgi:hypothetical protein